MTKEEDAYKLLKDSTWFEHVSDKLVHRIASVMNQVEAQPGQIFVEEGKPLENIIILEQGSLVRTKLASYLAADVEASTEMLRHMPRASRIDFVAKNSIIVDKIEGRARVSGLLHSIRPGGKAFATVIATGKETCKLWILNGNDFRSILSESPDFAVDIMAAMARELRSGSKSLRGLVQTLQSRQETDEKAKGDVPTIKVLCYDGTSWTKDGFDSAIKEFNEKHKSKLFINMKFTTERLSEQTASFAAGYDAVCLFVNDTASAEVLRTLSLLDVKMIAMRCAGFDRVDTKAAKAYNLTVARVPAYSPYAVAEMAVALLLSVNRKIHHASNRVKMANFTLDAGLMGMDIHGKTVGVMGTGKIGQIMCDIMLSFGIDLLCNDVYEDQGIKDKGGVYVSKDEIFARSDILFLAMPLLDSTHHTINQDTLGKLKPGVLIINTSRGGLVDTKALLSGLRSGVIGGVGMDVYENEQEYFFQDWSAKHMADEDLMSLLGNNNVILTAHQAFFTKEAVSQIVNTTLSNLKDFCMGKTGMDHPNNCIPKETEKKD